MNELFYKKIKRVGITLSEEIHTKIKVLAVTQEVTMQDWLLSALTEKLKREENNLKDGRSN